MAPSESRSNNTLAKVCVACGTLFLGTIVTLDTKLMYQTTSIGLDDTPKAFKKPWFLCWVMFVGMSLNLFIFFFQEWKKKSQQRKEGYQSLANGPVEQTGYSNMSLFGILWRCSFPACCDMTATGLQAMGFLYVAASVFAVLRGANIMFTSLVSIIFLTRRLTPGQVFGLLLVLLSLLVIGEAAKHCAFLRQFADDSSTGKGADDSVAQPGVNPRDAMYGIGLIVIAQLAQATQYVWEEKMMKDLKCPAMLLLGIEGVFGTIFMLVVVFPILGSLPGNDHGGCLENFHDSWHMLVNDAVNQDGYLVVMVLVRVFAIMGLNGCAIMVTNLLSAVWRALLQNGIRCAFIWTVDIIAFYVFTDGKFGEAWIFPYSQVQLFGFFLYFIGTLFYGKFISFELCRQKKEVNV